MPNMAVIGLDLGGTKLAGALITPTGKILQKSVVPLEGRQGRAVGELIRQELKSLLAAARSKRVNVTAVGVSVPGISYSSTGKVWAPNIPGWEDYPLRREILAALPDKRIRVIIDSDRACYILGETWRGAAKGCRNAIFLAVGTGIGAGILIDGRILRGAHDIAGAIGWLALDRPFRREYVGCGCFEYYASGEGLAKVAKEILAKRVGRTRARGCKVTELQSSKGLTARDVFSAYDRGDPVTKEVMTQAVEFWGMAVANLVSLFNPEKIIFGGGVFGPAAQFLGDIYAEAQKWAQPISIKQVKLQPSKLGGDAGLYGAGCLALQEARAGLVKSEARNPKAERNPKPQGRESKEPARY
jgi:glucokinase